MIFPDQSVRIVIATKPVDCRKGHDGLAAMAQAALGFTPKSGVMVVFRSRRGDRVKVLVWDGSGIVMISKRLEQGGFAWPKVGDGVIRAGEVARVSTLFCLVPALSALFAWPLLGEACRPWHGQTWHWRVWVWLWSAKNLRRADLRSAQNPDHQPPGLPGLILP